MHWLLAIGYWVLAVGYWLLAVGCWLLAIGYWILGEGVSNNPLTEHTQVVVGSAITPTRIV
jgi:hypothetical protein